MAIDIAGAKVGMLVQALSKDAGSTRVAAYKKSTDKTVSHYYKNGDYIGKIVEVNESSNRVKILLKSILKERIVIKISYLWIDPKDLIVIPVKTTLPTNVAELKAMYVVKGKTNVLVRRSPITGTPFAKVNGGQMVRVTGQVKQGFTEVVTDNGNGWISTQFLTTTKPVTVVTQPQPSVQQQVPQGTTPIAPVEPGIIYVPTDKPSDVKGNVILALLAAGVTFIGVKIFTRKSKPL
jgi:hypothetical protein